MVTFWRRYRQSSIREFHACGVYHADMNAYNLQIDHLRTAMDARFRPRPVVAARRLATADLEPSASFARQDKDTRPTRAFRSEGNWEALLEGYFNASRSV